MSEVRVCQHPFRAIRQKNALKRFKELLNASMDAEKNTKYTIEISILEAKLNGTYKKLRGERRAKVGQSQDVKSGPDRSGWYIDVYRVSKGKYEGKKRVKKSLKGKSVKVKREKYVKSLFKTVQWREGLLEQMRRGHSEFTPVKNFVFRSRVAV